MLTKVLYLNEFQEIIPSQLLNQIVQDIIHTNVSPYSKKPLKPVIQC